jgi:predicted house-cleaning noncanonical NTP pyrophosphatase (MazG superfamily)
MKYNKLVRDNIPEIIESNGKRAKFRVLDIAEYLSFLEKKLDEEVAEFHESKSIEELADIVEVVKALALALDSDIFKLSDTYFKKNTERGGFEKRICLTEVEE